MNEEEGGFLWGGFAIGAILGSSNPPIGGAGGEDDEGEATGGYQGFLSIGGVDIGLYLGGIVGIGRIGGLYGTAGICIGNKPYPGIGGGLHFGRFIGIGAILPIDIYPDSGEGAATSAAIHEGAQAATEATMASVQSSGLTEKLGEVSGSGLAKILSNPYLGNLASNLPEIAGYAATAALALGCAVLGTKAYKKMDKMGREWEGKDEIEVSIPEKGREGRLIDKLMEKEYANDATIRIHTKEGKEYSGNITDIDRELELAEPIIEDAEVIRQ